MSDSPEKELEEFLAALPAFRRKVFQQGISSFTQGEWAEWWKYERENPDVWAAELGEFQRLVRRLPHKLAAKYRNRLAKEYGPFAPLFMPAFPKGRPRLDDVVERVEQLRREQGLSRPRAVMRVNQERALSGLPPITTEQIRGLVKYRKRKSRNKASRPGKN